MIFPHTHHSIIIIVGSVSTLLCSLADEACRVVSISLDRAGSLFTVFYLKKLLKYYKYLATIIIANLQCI